jgi:ubiquinone/menaquinone biosynthesis C-methylase UbiE
MPSSEADRVREAYARRAATGADDRYDRTDPANRFLFERRDAAVRDLLARHALLPLGERRIIDVGCGNGAVLADFVEWGATPERCAGVDLLDERVAAARERLPDADIGAGSADALPWGDASFDIALQFTLLSSVLDDGVRQRVASETIRVLRPGGVLVYYDFIWNPGNRDTRGLRLGQLRSLYSGCVVDARRVTLAPPITRVVSRVSLGLCRMLERVPVLRSHYLAAIRTPNAG